RACGQPEGMRTFQRVAVIGDGLIGGSFAAAIREKKLCGHVVGAGRSAANLKTALERGIGDSVESDVAKAIRGANLVLIAAPVAQFEKIFLAMQPGVAPDTLVMDAGSTKRDVVAAARKCLGGKVVRFVPAHPIAGAEHSGAAAANPALFRDRRVVLTPIEENRAQDIDAIAELWGAIGARVSRMTPAEHDE